MRHRHRLRFLQAPTGIEPLLCTADLMQPLRGFVIFSNFGDLRLRFYGICCEYLVDTQVDTWRQGSGSAAIQRERSALAHHGVLFLDEPPEFTRSAIEVMRQPLEEGIVTTGSETEPPKTRPPPLCPQSRRFLGCHGKYRVSGLPQWSGASDPSECVATPQPAVSVRLSLLALCALD